MFDILRRLFRKPAPTLIGPTHQQGPPVKVTLHLRGGGVMVFNAPMSGAIEQVNGLGRRWVEEMKRGYNVVDINGVREDGKFIYHRSFLMSEVIAISVDRIPDDNAAGEVIGAGETFNRLMSEDN